MLITDAELGGHLPELAQARPGLRLLKIEDLSRASKEGKGSGTKKSEKKMPERKIWRF